MRFIGNFLLGGLFGVLFLALVLGGLLVSLAAWGLMASRFTSDPVLIIGSGIATFLFIVSGMSFAIDQKEAMHAGHAGRQQA